MKTKPKYKYGIRLRSKHTGEEITLGSQYDSEEEAIKNAEKQVCSRCNSFSIIPLPENAIWMDKETGFVRGEDFEKRMKWKEEMRNQKILQRIK